MTCKRSKVSEIKNKNFQRKKLTSFLKGSKMFWKSEKVLVEKNSRLNIWKSLIKLIEQLVQYKDKKFMNWKQILLQSDCSNLHLNFYDNIYVIESSFFLYEKKQMNWGFATNSKFLSHSSLQPIFTLRILLD